MALEDEYPHLKNPTASEWRVVAVRSAICVLLCILISALAHLAGRPLKHGEIRKPQKTQQKMPPRQF